MEAQAAARPPARGSKVNNIQALRAFAAVLVVLYHTGYTWPGGYTVGSFGVDIFFVISGYIMARICDGNASFFLRRRLIRVVPPYWVMTLFVFVLAWKLPRFSGTTPVTPKELLESLFFIPFLKGNGLYHPVLFVGWTLNCEMFFYLAIAAALLLSRRRAIWIASAAIVLVQATLHQVSPNNPILGFYANPIVLEFPLGVLAYHAVRRTSAEAALRLCWASSFAAAAAAISLVLCEGFHLFLPSMDWARVSLTSFLLILSAAMLSKGGWDTRFGSVVLAGDASYIMYLLHPYCINFMGRLIAPHIHAFDITRLPGALFAIAVSVLAAVWVHLKLELPSVDYLNLRFGGHRRSTEFRPEVPSLPSTQAFTSHSSSIHPSPVE